MNKELNDFASSVEGILPGLCIKTTATEWSTRNSYCQPSDHPHGGLPLNDYGVLLSHWPLQLPRRMLLVSQCLTAIWVCTESSSQPGGKFYKAGVHSGWDPRSLLCSPWPLTTLGFPLLSLICVTWTCTVSCTLSWVWDQRCPRSLPPWPQETMKK